MMMSVHTSPKLTNHQWGGRWQHVALWGHACDHAPILEAIYALHSNFVTLLSDFEVIRIQAISRKQAASVKIGLPDPAAMHYDPETEQIIISPATDVPFILEWADAVAPQSPKSHACLFVLDLADEATLTMLHVTLDNTLGILMQRQHPVLLDLV